MSASMPWWDAVLLGAVEGLTEFLPVSSTGHLTILEKLLGYSIDSPDVTALTAFTAIIQVGAVAATLLYFRADIRRIITAWVRGVAHAQRRDDPDYRFGWAVILGSLPIGVVGLLFKDQIETTLRSLWIVGSALILWSAVMWLADRTATQTRHEGDVTWKDTLLIGLTQCLVLIPGVSRSGATMSAGLLRDLDRVTVTRLSFFLSIPALTAAGALQVVDQFDNISRGVGPPHPPAPPPPPPPPPPPLRPVLDRHQLDRRQVAPAASAHRQPAHRTGHRRNPHMPPGRAPRPRPGPDAAPTRPPPPQLPCPVCGSRLRPASAAG